MRRNDHDSYFEIVTVPIASSSAAATASSSSSASAQQQRNRPRPADDDDDDDIDDPSEPWMSRSAMLKETELMLLRGIKSNEEIARTLAQMSAQQTDLTAAVRENTEAVTKFTRKFRPPRSDKGNGDDEGEGKGKGKDKQ
ncbi:hypothetical protein BGX31_006061 [Mortierella sp. GBA43]|nr:hypothetical protein BGX31_006061 [Mortierella sp. GBA43]